MGRITLEIEGERIQIDSKLSIPENAEVYYEKAKKARKKIEGVPDGHRKDRKGNREDHQTEGRGAEEHYGPKEEG